MIVSLLPKMSKVHPGIVTLVNYIPRAQARYVCRVVQELETLALSSSQFGSTSMEPSGKIMVGTH